MDINEFVKLPFKSQLHKCCLMYCMANGLKCFDHRKPSQDYYKCRAYLWKLPTQDIKNIAIMLDRQRKPVFLYDMQKEAAKFVEKERAEDNKKRVERIEKEAEKEKDLDEALLDFLR